MANSSAKRRAFVCGDVAHVSTPGRTKAAKQPSSIERIQRLERLERERLEEKSRKEERRRQIIAGARPSGGRNDLVDDIERVTKYPMALLGIAWLVIAIIIGTTDVTGTAPTVLVAILFALWVILLAEYLVRLVVTPDRRGYLRRRWVEPATVVVPPLQGWHLVGIEKTSLLATRGGVAGGGRAQAPQPVPGAHRRHGHPVRRGLAGAAVRGESQGQQHPQLPGRSVVGHRHRDHRGLRGPVSRPPRAAGPSPWC